MDYFPLLAILNIDAVIVSKSACVCWTLWHMTVIMAENADPLHTHTHTPNAYIMHCSHAALHTHSHTHGRARLTFTSTLPPLIFKLHVCSWHPSLVAVLTAMLRMSQPQTSAFGTSVSSLKSNSLFILVNTRSDFNYRLTDGADYMKWGSWNPNWLLSFKNMFVFLKMQIEPLKMRLNK